MRNRLSSVVVLFIAVAVAGINWKSVWLEPRTPVVLTVGEMQPYIIVGLNGADVKADLTKSPYLRITTSDAGVLDIDREKGVFIGKKPGHVDIQISFSEAWEMVPAFVREPRTDSTSTQKVSTNDMDGIWKAVFTGPLGEQPKMVSEIFFDLISNGDSLTGTVHAASWPGDGEVSDGKIDGDRATLTMIGHLPFQAGRAGAMVTGYPKLCFTGIRHGNGMNLDLLWTEAQSSCESGRLLPMAAKKVAD